MVGGKRPELIILNEQFTRRQRPFPPRRITSAKKGHAQYVSFQGLFRVAQGGWWRPTSADDLASGVVEAGLRPPDGEMGSGTFARLHEALDLLAGAAD